MPAGPPCAGALASSALPGRSVACLLALPPFLTLGSSPSTYLAYGWCCRVPTFVPLVPCRAGVGIVTVPFSGAQAWV